MQSTRCATHATNQPTATTHTSDVWCEALVGVTQQERRSRATLPRAKEKEIAVEGAKKRRRNSTRTRRTKRHPPRHEPRTGGNETDRDFGRQEIRTSWSEAGRRNGRTRAGEGNPGVEGGENGRSNNTAMRTQHASAQNASPPANRPTYLIHGLLWSRRRMIVTK